MWFYSITAQEAAIGWIIALVPVRVAEFIQTAPEVGCVANSRKSKGRARVL
jgi:hypothetical protein